MHGCACLTPPNFHSSFHWESSRLVHSHPLCFVWHRFPFRPTSGILEGEFQNFTYLLAFPWSPIFSPQTLSKKWECNDILGLWWRNELQKWQHLGAEEMAQWLTKTLSTHQVAVTPVPGNPVHSGLYRDLHSCYNPVPIWTHKERNINIKKNTTLLLYCFFFLT